MAEDEVRKVAVAPHILDFGPPFNMKLRYYACVSEVITQADVRIKELVTWGI